MSYMWKNIKQKILPHTLYGRSLMIIVVPILLLQMIVAYIFIDRHLDSMSDKLVYALAGEIGMIIDQIKQSRMPFREVPVQIHYTEYSLGKGQPSRNALKIVVQYLLGKVLP